MSTKLEEQSKVSSVESDKYCAELLVWPWNRYRTHLEREVEYLRGQLAQRQRRVDELQDVLAVIATPRPVAPKSTVNVTIPAGKPRGWEQYRAVRKAEAEKEDTDAF